MSVVEWEVLDTGVSTAAENMDKDSNFLAELSQRKRPLIHYYDWKGDSATFGTLVKPERFLNLEMAKKLGVTLARRPTGGGIVFHIWDLAFSVLVPATCPLFSKNTLENYSLINRAVLAAVEEFLQHSLSLELTPNDAQAVGEASRRFCMARPTKYDVVMKGRKVAGAAQRQTKDGFLHQGTIALTLPDNELLTALLPKDSRILDAMNQYTFPLLPALATQSEQQEAKKSLKQLLTKYLTQGTP